ncbi:GNAT family N-acetyltransferase, partial [Mycobacterium tuberculosis]|nr:GNAT family N-acetyltransferase [Mycobacterium tuberculosis]
DRLGLWRELSGDVVEGEEARTVYAALIGRPGVTVFVAEDDGVPAATCTMITVPNLTRRGRPYAFIENVVTRSDRQRRGLG